MQKGSAPMNHIKLDREKKIPHVKTKLKPPYRNHAG